MILPLDPVVIDPAGLTPVRIPLENTGVGVVAQVKLANESPCACKVQLGAQTHWLSAWYADLFEVPPGAIEVLITPVLIASATNAPSSLILPTLASLGETIPGTYPVSLNRLTNLAAGTVNLTASSVAITGNVPVSITPGQQVAIAVAGAPIDPRSIRALTTTDQVTGTIAVAGVPIDPRSIRALTTTDQLGVGNINGTQLQVSQGQTLLQNVTSPNNTLSNYPITVPANVRRLVLVSLQQGPPWPQQLIAVGTTSGIQYLPWRHGAAPSVMGPAYLSGPFFSARDSSLTLYVDTRNNVLGTWVWMLIGITDDSRLEDYTSLPWEVPNQPATWFNTGVIAIAGNVSILPALPNVVYYLFHLEILCFLANFSQTFKDQFLFDTVTGISMWQNLSNQPVPPNNPVIESFDFGGQALSMGAGLAAHNNDTMQGATVIGSISYSKA